MVTLNPTPYTLNPKPQTAGQTSDPSPRCDVVTLPLPPPAPVRQRVEDVQPNAIRLSWSCSDETERDATSVCEVGGRQLPCTLTLEP